MYPFEKPIMEGKLSESSLNSDSVTLKCYFTSTSYQLNKMRFKLRLSLFQKFIDNYELQAPLTSNSTSLHPFYNVQPNMSLQGTLMPPPRSNGSAFSIASVTPESSPKGSFGVRSLVDEQGGTASKNEKKGIEGDTSFVFEHNGFNLRSGVSFLACIISPEFYIYSKKVKLQTKISYMYRTIRKKAKRMQNLKILKRELDLKTPLQAKVQM
jgi:hypothetical protein